MVFLVALLAGPAFCSGAPDNQFYGFTGIDTVSVNGQFLDVDVTGADINRVDLTVVDSAGSLFGSNSYRVKHRETGNRLEIWVESDWPFFSAGRGTIRLVVPRRAALSAETVSGRIIFRDLADECHARTVSGAIELRGVRGSVQAKTVSGAIRGSDIELTDDSAFTTVSGGVDVVSGSPLDSLRFDLSTVSGRLIVGTIGAYRGLRMGFDGPLVRGSTVSGSISFR